MEANDAALHGSITSSTCLATQLFSSTQLPNVRKPGIPPANHSGTHSIWNERQLSNWYRHIRHGIRYISERPVCGWKKSRRASATISTPQHGSVEYRSNVSTQQRTSGCTSACRFANTSRRAVAV
jgi:hypothetical protein